MIKRNSWSKLDISTLSDQEVIDLVVDGEFAESDVPELLHRLQSMPEGWKQCVLRLLEDHVLRRSCADLYSRTGPWEVASHRFTANHSAPNVSRNRFTLGRVWVRVAQLACLFVVGVLVGFGSAAIWLTSSADRGLIAAPAAHDTESGVYTGARTDKGYLAGHVPESASVPPVSTASGGRPQGGSLQSVGGSGKQPSQPRAFARSLGWELVSVPVKCGDRWEELPVWAKQAADVELEYADWNRRTEAVLKALQRAGFEVTRRQQFITVPMEDGRRLIIPVAEYELSVHPQ